ncbi:MAG TPA: hypothetical protein VFG43_03750 [Geminicoccaceae bacterium]|nr:hypothetical protein [Geminicoccaceae bacterium]
MTRTMARPPRADRGVWAMLAALACLASAPVPPAAAAPVTLDGITFDDELGGLEVKDGWGTGRLDDPFVVVEDIFDDGPAILTIRGLRANFGNRIGTQHLVGFALTKIVRNLTPYDWESFELELRERLTQSSTYRDGLSFAQDAVVPHLFASDRFTSVYKTDEPLDAAVFSGGVVRRGETVTVRVVITDYSPNVEIFLLQRRNAPVAAIGPQSGAGEGRPHYRR